jgi:hypothetical protein
MRFTTIRRALAALVATGAATLATTGAAHAYLPDPVRLVDTQVDFGDNTWVGWPVYDPLLTGSVQWSIDSGYYTPTLVGALHLHDAKNEWGRMHIEYYDGAGNYMYTAHSTAHEAPDNDHYAWSVNLKPPTLMQIVQVKVCTEISSNGSSYSQVDCTGKLLMN